MKKLIPSIAILIPLLANGPASATLCDTGPVPAATLLLPYFEVDLEKQDGVTTLFSINNAAAAPALAHVVLWTDWSFPTVAFDVYLTGYDVLSINLRNVFDGNIPITSDAPNDPNQESVFCGEKSPCGGALGFVENRHWDDADPETTGEQGFLFCDQIFPAFFNPVIVGNAIDRVRNGHTGGVVASLDACVGFDHGDDVARGYVTIDSVSECSLAIGPSDLGIGGTPYFVDGGTGVANNRNQLWGDWFLVDPANNFARGDTLVHIEADDSFNAAQIPAEDPETGAPLTDYTFYGRYLDPLDGRDNREPLGTIWASRYLNGGAFDQTELLVWRDTTSSELAPVQQGEPGDWCAAGPSWYPLDETEVLLFNEAEDGVEMCFRFSDPPFLEEGICFGLATGRYAVGEDLLSGPYDFGWAYLNLNLREDAPIGDHDFGSDGFIAQSYVTTMHSAQGRFSVGFAAIELSSACLDFNERLNGAFQNGGQNDLPFF